MTHIDLSKRTDFPAAFDERATVTQLLSYVRLTVHAKCDGYFLGHLYLPAHGACTGP